MIVAFQRAAKLFRMKPRLVVWGLAFLLSFEFRPLSFAADSAPRPNILLAIGDNWAYPHAGALGDPTVKTPVFDRVAREGVLFTHAFCPVPSCSPTRSSLLTGRAAHQLEDAASLWSAFPKKFRVFTDLLRESGYEVGFTGKGWAPGNYKDYGWTENPAGKQFKSFEEFLSTRAPARPFFFWLGNTDTALHKWRYEPESWAGLDEKSVRIPPEFPDVPLVRSNLLAYYGGVMRLDRDVGSALALLEKQGLRDNTIVIYTSDNGWQMPRGLANCYDTGCRVPLAIRGTRAASFPAGRKVDEFISLTDFAPTFLELAGLRPAPEMTGRSFADLLTGKPGAVPRDAVFLERERHANVRRGDLSYPIRGIRTKDFLYLRNLRPDRWPAGDPQAYFAVGDYGDIDPSPTKDFIRQNSNQPGFKTFQDLSFAKRPAEELYDLRRDPHQVVNVAGRPEYDADQRRLRERLDRWMRDTADPRVDPDYDAWDKYPYFGGKTSDKRKATAK